MAKFKIGDLITEVRKPTYLCLIKDVKETDYIFLVLCSNNNGRASFKGNLKNLDITFVDRICQLVDLENLPKRLTKIGKVKCAQCGKEIELGESCYEIEGEDFCSEICILNYVNDEKKINVEEGDLLDYEEVETAAFTISEEEKTFIKDSVESAKRGAVRL